MIYDHIVKFNGKYYNAGEEVPEKEELLPFDGTEGLSDEDIVMDADAVAKPRSSSKRGRQKKSE